MKPRLLFVVPDLGPGGAQPMNLRLATQLRARGWPVRVAVLFNREQTLGEAVCSGLEITVLGQRGVRGQVRALWRLVQMARNADIVIGGVECAATTYGFLAAKLSRREFLSWMHTAFELYQAHLSPADRWLSQVTYRRLPWVVFPSRGACASLASALGGMPQTAQWQVIENFLAHSPLDQPVDTPVPDDRIYRRPVIVGVGRLDLTSKAFDRLVRIHAGLLANGIAQHLVILGEGPDRPTLEQEIARLGVGETVFLPSHVNNVADWLAHATVFALCSRYEGFSLVLLEALAAGVPTVAMDCPAGPREILLDGKTGVLVPEGDENAMQAAIAKLLADSGLGAQFAQAGLVRARDFAPENIVPKWEALLQEVWEQWRD
jgi:glycosyltransferase involved in cell wall biosynthesis